MAWTKISGKSKKALISVCFTLVLCAGAAQADDWCLPTNECMGEPSPIQNNQYETCEETCRMRDPVPVRGLDAKLYDVKCEGDSSSSEFRMMLGEYTDWNGNRQAYLVTPHGTEQLERCAL